ncbi:hypothetical protein GIS00_03325 [Nakamurella sp. YIM 132087]|uniref:Fis family transcriptional regulator n=1 Tax=Nakamurella alba TaxID=2665158 RepID=A0A7K1FFX9_9ACTN|nr:hypothetical protein [Nakamurella alba]MTD12976.1 hypothetical protein [Nakamurella alba]
MRWESLFDDLEARFDQLADAALLAELADRQRVALGAVPFVARLTGAIGAPVRLHVTTGASVTGQLARVGPDWCLLAEGPGREVVVRLAAVTGVEGLGRATGEAPAGVALRLDLRHVLRGVVRDRSPVAVVVTGGEFTGTLDRVGADFVELARHAAWESRRPDQVRSVLTVPLTAVVLVRAVPAG